MLNFGVEENGTSNGDPMDHGNQASITQHSGVQYWRFGFQSHFHSGSEH